MNMNTKLAAGAVIETPMLILTVKGENNFAVDWAPHYQLKMANSPFAKSVEGTINLALRNTERQLNVHKSLSPNELIHIAQSSIGVEQSINGYVFWFLVYRGNA